MRQRMGRRRTNSGVEGGRGGKESKRRKGDLIYSQK